MTSSRRLLFSSPSLSTTTATTVVPIFFGPQPQCSPPRLLPSFVFEPEGTWVIMNRVTRRLGKIPDEVKKEVQPFYLNRAAISREDTDIDKIEKLTDDTAEIIRTGLVPRWSDMDANQHVNNVKYIGWLLESVPINVLEDYNMKRMTLEYRRECRQSNFLESLTSMQVEKDEVEDEEDRIFRLDGAIWMPINT
ncbi:hypothetical protein OROMI_000949 [Orobanche minor]